MFNDEYCRKIGGIPLEQMNEVERRLVLTLKFGLTVSRREYATYYFQLLGLDQRQEKSFVSQRPLSKRRAERLGAMAKATNRYQERHVLRRTSSLDDIAILPKPAMASLPFGQCSSMNNSMFIARE